MKYFFVLGNNPVLSIAEILSVFPSVKVLYLNNEILLIELPDELDAKIINKMGGVIKIGQIISEPRNSNTDTIIRALKNSLDLSEHSGKFKFGFSYYGHGKINIKALGMELKKCLQENGISARWVVSREKNLSSVVVETNKLVDSGAEIVLLKTDSAFLIGKTLAVQPFKELSYRDYGRPNRDDQSGMLPPKLAQIMINLAVQGNKTHNNASLQKETILDPFCGSGTVLTEAALNGFVNIIGSDVSQKAVDDSKKNLEWIKQKYIIHNTKYIIQKVSATEISKKIKEQSVDYIVTEPFLGPQRGFIKVNDVIKELNDLYSKSLNEFYKVLKPHGRVVMIFPIFKISGKNNFLSPNLIKFKTINPLPEYLRKSKVISNSNSINLNRNSIIYGREGQRVWREIVILEK